MSDEFPDLAALQAGEESAWNSAFSFLWPLAVNAARHPTVGLTPSEAEDAALLVTITHRRAVSLARRKSAVKRPQALAFSGGANSSENMGEIADDPNSHLTEVELREMILLLHQALKCLDDESRLLLLGKIVFGYSYEELSAKHGLPLGTVCSKVARSLRKVQQTLDESPNLMKEMRQFLR
ncbi:MAG: sigma-70 family RNA polymerase sigma factor [Verrucomicrobiales bacterium]|nr:sigma-70 family RNA polymerase sigma factor [Verrucomicrobiales bacterium]